MMRRILLVMSLAIVAALSSTLVSHAAQTVPYKINFQGKLTDSSNNNRADGTYNMRFRLYSAASGGSALWTETHAVASGQGVSLMRGMFNVQLGSYAALTPSLFASQPLYLEVELPDPGTAMGSSPSWSEGPMSPRQAINSAPYTMNADTIDGIDGASLAQLSSNNTFSGNTTTTGTQSHQLTSSTAFRVQNAGGTNALLVDTNNLAVKIGGGDISPDASPTLFVLDYKNTTGDPTGVEGAMYYNLALKKLRCFEGGYWMDCLPEANTRFEHHSDFLSGNFTLGFLDNVLVMGIANGGSVTRMPGELGHPGIARLGLSTSSSSFSSFGSNFDSGNTTGGIRFGGGATWIATQQMRLNAVAATGNTFGSYNGFVDNLQQFASSGLQNGCFVIHSTSYFSGNWTGLCAVGGSAIPAGMCEIKDGSNNAITPVVGVWYTLTTAVNASATSVSFVVENTSSGVTGTCSVSANIPTVGVSTGAVIYRPASSAQSPSVDYDYVETQTKGLSRQ